ncbi:unnamed protein product [Arctogadus glacialis]
MVTCSTADGKQIVAFFSTKATETCIAKVALRVELGQNVQLTGGCSVSAAVLWSRLASWGGCVEVCLFGWLSAQETAGLQGQPRRGQPTFKATTGFHPSKDLLV